MGTKLTGASEMGVQRYINLKTLGGTYPCAHHTDTALVRKGTLIHFDAIFVIPKSYAYVMRSEEFTQPFFIFKKKTILFYL